MSLTPVVLRNGNDTYVAESAPSRNFSNSTQMVVKSGTGTRFFSFLYFVRPFPLGATIISATLRLYQISAESVTHTVTLRRIDAPWTLSTTNWNNRPPSLTTGQVQVAKAASPVGTEWAFDVTAHMQLVSDGALWRGWQVFTSEDDFLYFGSTQHSQYKPVLEVQWADNPDAPSTLSPSGNRAVSLAKPVLRFDFTDVAGNTALQAVQVQINATNVWTAPSFDSGEVTTSDPELDLANTSYVGLADGASTYWRVRVQDGAGLWSDWSAGAQFQRRTKGVLAFTNPPVSGLISEPTPPIIWTLTGRTQAAWQLFITPANNNSVVLYTTAKITGSDVSHTLPDGVLKDDSAYNVHLRVWDTIARENTPGDQAYAYAVRGFTYDYDATVDPVTGLAGTDLAPAPGVTLTWTRATAPDSFVIRRNGIIIASGLTPASLSTGGTGYAYTDRGADPRKAVTWRVDSVVNGKTSAANPTLTQTLLTEGIWISDPTRGISVELRGGDPGNWDMGETADTYTPVGGTRVIRITQSLRGFEGSIVGELRAKPGATLDQQEQDLWALKSTPGIHYLLTMSNQTIRVIIGNLVIKPVDHPDIQKVVTFNFWAGEPPFTPVL